jgi:hypothetical protein
MAIQKSNNYNQLKLYPLNYTYWCVFLELEA